MYPDISFSEIAEINPPRPKLSLEPEVEVSFIPMGDVNDSGRWQSRQVRQFQEVNKGYTCFLNNDVLFAKITPCMENGKGCLVTSIENGVGFGSTEFHVLRARTNGDSGFIYQWSMYIPFRQKAAASMTGSAGQQRVPASFLKAFSIPSLEKSEQAKIAEILSTVDRAIEQTDALIAKQQRIKTGLMQDLLTRGIDEHGNIRSEQTHKFKDSPLGRIPVEWDVKSVEQLLAEGIIADVQDGNHGESHPKSRDFVSEGVPFIMASDISEGFINIEHTKKITYKQYLSLRIGFSKPGDILLSHKASIGFVAQVPEWVNDLMLTPQVTYYRIGRTSVLQPDYLAQFFRSAKFQEPLKGLAKQSTRDYIGILAQRKLQIAYPGLANEQLKISSVLAAQDNRIADLRVLYGKYSSLKTALMQDLLTGKKRVTPLLKD
jgi:type I restriction enzyme S subunit